MCKNQWKDKYTTTSKDLAKMFKLQDAIEMSGATIGLRLSFCGAVWKQGHSGNAVRISRFEKSG